MPVYKLSYFDIRCKAELARLMFAYQGQAYTDVRVKNEEWEALKPKTKFGMLPTLEIDGKEYGESVAINNYLARQFGLYGNNDIERLEIDEVVGITQDMWSPIIDWIHALIDKADNLQTLKTTNEETLFPKYLTNLEKILKEKDTGFYVGNKLSYADLAVFDVLDIEVPEVIIEKFPLVKKNRDMVMNDEKLKAYISSRSEALF